MQLSSFKTLFSRILVVLAGGAVVYFAYLFVQVTLAPVPVPPPPAGKKTVTFNPRLDVTRHPAFETLRPLGPFTVELRELGRTNPFVPFETATSSATTTRVATSTQ